MFSFQFRLFNRYLKTEFGNYGKYLHVGKATTFQTAKQLEEKSDICTKTSTEITPAQERIPGDIYAAARVIPMVYNEKEPIVLSFDDVPGPKSLKYISIVRYYLSEIGTQVTAGIITLGLNITTYINKRKPIRNLSTLFDEYGPVVRFISPVGSDIVLLNHPDHIQKVFTMEGDYPVRSTLESLEKYRMERRVHVYGGLYTVHGQEWIRQRTAVYSPVNGSLVHHAVGLSEICDMFTQKIYSVRNYQDEMSKDLYQELHKWAFDSMGLLMFSKKFSMLETDLVSSQCDVSWMYHSLEKATEAIIKCETGLHLWKLFTTPAWYNLVKYCDSLDSLIGKHVLETEQDINKGSPGATADTSSLTACMLMSDQNLKTEDIATVLMDMLLIGVNTITSSMSFLLYNLAKHQRVQRALYSEIESWERGVTANDISKIKENTPYLQACIKETLRLVPPIPLLTRILPRNITLDRYNIPRGTLIIMSTQDASLKESNYDDATKFYPERWLQSDIKEYHTFASIPFGFGARKCLGQNIAEILLSLLTIRTLQRYKLEYHYGDVQPTRSFIARPNKPLKVRFIDRI